MVHLSAAWKEGLLLTCEAITVSHSSIVSGNFTICFTICLYIYVCKIGETLIKLCYVMLCYMYIAPGWGHLRQNWVPFFQNH